MIYTGENKEEAKHLIGKKVRCWTTLMAGDTDVFEGILQDVEEIPYYFRVSNLRLVVKNLPFKSFQEDYDTICFQYIKENTDGRGNYLLDFT